MADPTNFRMQRIEKLLYELRYEIERGVMQEEIDETLEFDFYIPISRRIPNGLVYADFRVRPIGREMMNMDLVGKRMKLVKGGKKD